MWAMMLSHSCKSIVNVGNICLSLQTAPEAMLRAIALSGGTVSAVQELGKKEDRRERTGSKYKVMTPCHGIAS